MVLTSNGLRLALLAPTMMAMLLIGPASKPSQALALGPTASGLADEAKEELTAAVDARIRRHDIPGAVAGVWFDSGESWVVARGWTGPNHRTPRGVDSKTRIASITKSFTCTLLLMLVDEGRLRLEDPIARYVASVPNGERIKLRMLCANRSGLPDYQGALLEP